MKILFTSLLLLLALPEWTAAQCSSTAYAVDQSESGSLRTAAATTQQGCEGTRTVSVRAWIDIEAWLCYSGDAASFPGYCYSASSAGNAGVLLGKLAWGRWQGHSSNWYAGPASTGGSYAWPRRDYLDAGTKSRAQACVEQGRVCDPIVQVCEPGPNTPIIMATGQRADYRLTPARDGVFFDLDADGIAEKVAWTLPDAEVAFLAIDRNGDGQITSGRELFGNHTHPDAADGFAALILLTKEANNGIALASVSADDPLYERLLLWTDRNHNGISEVAELQPVSDVFSDVGLGYEDHCRPDGNGNTYLSRGWAYLRTANGRNKPDPENFKEIKARRRFIYDVALAAVR